MSIVRPPSNLSVFPQDTKITAENAQDQDLIVRVMLMGSTVPLFDVFLLVIAVLVEAASQETTERLRDYTSPTSVAGVEVLFKERLPPRTSSPFFEIQSLMKTMALVPRFMVTKGVFQEALVSVEIDGVNVADGFLEKKEATVGLTNINANVSLS